MATHAPPEVRRAQILEAALHCFGEKGLHAARMDEIARRSGLSKGAIYFHFASKEEIFLALFEAYEQAIFAEWEKIEDPEDPLHAIEQLGEIALRQILSSRPLLEAWPEFIRHPKARGRMAKIYERSRERIAALVANGVRTGRVRECQPGAVAATLTAIVEGLLLQAFADPSYDPLPDLPEAWEIVARGLAA